MIKINHVIVSLQMSILIQSEIYTLKLILWNLRKLKTGQHFLKGVTCILQCQQHSRGRVRLCCKHGQTKPNACGKGGGLTVVLWGASGINHFTQTCLNEEEDYNNGAAAPLNPHMP